MASNYPPGAENDPRAPYNEIVPEWKDIELAVSTSLSRSCNVFTDDYYTDSEDRLALCEKPSYYYNQEYYSPCELLEKLVMIADANIALLKKRIEGKDAPVELRMQLSDWKKIKASAECWTEDELEVIHE